MAVIELYKVEVHNTQYRFTSSNLDVLFENAIYKPLAIDRQAAIEQSEDPLKSSTSFRVVAGSELANLALNPPLNIAPKITIYRSENARDYATVFTGRIMAGKWDDGFVVVELEPLHTELQVTGLNETITRLCRYNLGSRKCGKVITEQAAEVTDVFADVITLNVALSLEYEFGRLRKDLDHYFIAEQLSTTQLRLLHPAQFAIGDVVYLAKGCDRTLATCHKRFNNAANFGGAVNLPTKNPYQGDPIDR